VKLQYISIDEQVAEILRKSLPNKKNEYLKEKLRLMDITSLVVRE